MHRVMEFAMDQGIGSDNPFARIKTYKLGTYHTWTDDELSGYESRWPIGTPARYAVLLYTGQRGSDAVAILRPGVKASAIDLTRRRLRNEDRHSS